MKVPHKIDLTRLDKLRVQLEAARGATDRAQQAALDAHRKLGNIQSDARNMVDKVSQNILNKDAHELRKNLSEFEEQARLQTIVKNDLFAKRAPLAERAEALGQLVDRCAAFAGALKYAR